MYWPDLPFWKLWESQLIAESNLNPLAKSAVGAEGLAQFMPNTWQDVTKQLGLHGDRYSAEISIQAGAYYDAQLRHQWRNNRPTIEAHWLAVSSFNRGVGNILKDQRECEGALLWDQIKVCTAKHTMETLQYVDRIRSGWKSLEVK